jgi:tetratricopeptide (TPR) repeat protein
VFRGPVSDFGLPVTTMKLSKIACLVVVLALLGGCSSVYDVNAAMKRGGYQQVLEDTRDIDAFPERDRTLVLNYRAHAKLALGYHQSARHDFLHAWNIMNLSEGGGIASAYFFTERQRFWLGDPYERAFNSWYLGMLYYQAGMYDDAMACFRNAIFVDTGDIEAGMYAADWVPALLMRLRAFLMLNDEEGARIMMEEIERLPEEPANFDPNNPWLNLEAQRDANTVIMLELGRGPYFTAEGHHGSVRVINQGEYRERYAKVWIDGEPMGRAYMIGDTFFQAITRGGRVMDDILEGKAIAKTAGIATGAVAMHIGRVLMEEGEGGTKTAGAITMAAGAAVLAASLLMRADADTRGNDLLPAETHLLMAKLPPGEYEVEVRFYDDGDRELVPMRQTAPLVVPQRGDGTLLLRSHPRYTVPNSNEWRTADPYADD